MKNYIAPEIEVIEADALELLKVSTSDGDVEVNVGGDFF